MMTFLFGVITDMISVCGETLLNTGRETEERERWMGPKWRGEPEPADVGGTEARFKKPG
jgi:hypothetical protein